MQKLFGSFLKTAAPASLNFFSKPYACPFSRSSRLTFLTRSYESTTTDGEIGKPFMASSAPVKVPPPLIEEGLGRKFWIKSNKEWTQALYTPFVVSLAAGNLNLDTFRHYIAQDVHFLRAFATAYEMAEEFADDDDAKVGICELRKGVLTELKMHDSFVQEWGFDLPKENMPNAATVKYTDFLLATASGKVEGLKAPGKLDTPFEKTKLAAYTLGAMTPCMRLYAFLGKEFQDLLSSSKATHPYKKWIDNYSSEEFQAAALQTEDLLEKLSVSLTGEELDVIEKLYHQAMKLEIEFFLAQPIVQTTVTPLAKVHNPAEMSLMLFSDFDLTCTVVDSSAVLAEIAILTVSRSDQIQSGNELARMSSVDLRSTWEELSKQYTEEYEQCIENMLLSNTEEKFNYEGLYKALEHLSEFEKKANIRVIDSGVLKGLHVEDIKRAGERLILQNGCKSFFQSAVKSNNVNTNIHVLSYCWCADLIRSAFSSRGDLETLNIHANEFVYEDSLSTGEIIKKVESPINKVQAFESILLQNNSSKDGKNVTVYIGDSVGDLLCLLKADVGIVIGSSSSLRKVGSHFGVSFVPLFPGVIEKQKQVAVDGSLSSWNVLSGVLYTVSSWAEIHAFILGWS